MLKKKFKVRVIHYVNTSYAVEWSYYYIIPIWHSLCWWYAISITHEDARWVTNCLKYEDAIELAEKIKTIEDVHKYYEKDNEKEREFCISRNEYLRNNAPRKTIYFN